MPRVFVCSMVMAIAVPGCSAPQWTPLCKADMTQKRLRLEAYLGLADAQKLVAFDPACPEKTYPIDGWGFARDGRAARAVDEIQRAMPQGVAIRYRLDAMPYAERGQVRLMIIGFERLGSAKAFPARE